MLGRTCHLAPLFSLLFYLPPLITQTFLRCSHSLHHPSFDTTPIFHNTQTNKVANPCIPCSNDGHILDVKHAKGWWIMKTKKQNPKTHCVHTIWVTICLVTPLLKEEEILHNVRWVFSNSSLKIQQKLDNQCKQAPH